MKNETGEDKPKSSINGLVAVLGGVAILCGGLGIANLASNANALSTTRAAEAMSAEVREMGAANFLLSVGYTRQPAEGEQIYFRPIVDGFWKSEVQVVIAPETAPDGMIFRDKNLLFDAYNSNKVGRVIASLSGRELAKQGYTH